MESVREQHLFEKVFFCTIINVTFDQLHASLLNKNEFLENKFTDHTLLHRSVQQWKNEKEVKNNYCNAIHATKT